MKGGAISFSLHPLTADGTQILPNPLVMAGDSVIQFIDDTQDTFFNTFRRVKFSKSCSKCYLVRQGNRNVPYQLIYRDGNVFQYAVYDFNRFRLVQQNTQMTDKQAEIFLSLPEGLPNSTFQFSGSGRGSAYYNQWEDKLLEAIREGNISIDQLLRFFFRNGNINTKTGFKVDHNLKNFWHHFYSRHQGEFF
jgi:hypothetical protein